MSKKSKEASGDNTDKTEEVNALVAVDEDTSTAPPSNETIKDADGASKKESTTEQTSSDKKEGVDSTKSSNASKEDTSNVTKTSSGSDTKEANSIEEINSKNIDTSTDKKEAATTTASTSTTPHQHTSSFQQQYQSFSDMQDLDDGYTDSNDTLLTMSFNQDGGCLAVGTGSGFRICNVHPFEENLRRTLGGDSSSNGGSPGDGGIAHIEMLYRTNLLAITGHSNSPQFPPNKVLMYDDHLQRTVGDLSFRQKVLTTKLRRDRIVVVLRDRTYIYNFADMTLLDKVYTGENPNGLVAISIDNGGVGGSTVTGVSERAQDVLGSGRRSNSQQRNNGMVLAVPSTQKGQVRVELYGLRRQTFIDAHDSQLGALALSVDGSLLATASERGTVIRLFDTRGVTIGGGSGHGSSRQDATSVSSSVPLREFRRGVERASISCLTFSLDSTWLGCASDHGTVHVFQTHGPNDNKATEKKTRSSSMTGKAIRMLPKLVTQPKKYMGMDGVHSYAQVRGVPHPYACAFVPDREQTIAVAGMDEYGNGCLLLAEFGKLPISGITVSGDTKVYDSEARRVGYHRFFKSKNPSASHTTSRGRTKSKDFKPVDVVEGGAYIDDKVDLRMNHIKISEEDEYAVIDYKEK